MLLKPKPWGWSLTPRQLRDVQTCTVEFSMGASRTLLKALLGGSWVVISRVISPFIWVISIVTLLITPDITTPEPPSSGTSN